MVAYWGFTRGRCTLRLNLYQPSLGILLVLFVAASLLACKAEVGSEKWCAELKAKLDQDLTFDDSTQYAKHCLFK